MAAAGFGLGVADADLRPALRPPPPRFSTAFAFGCGSGEEASSPASSETAAAKPVRAQVPPTPDDLDQALVLGLAQFVDAVDESGKKIPQFSAGDTLRVNVKVVEGSRERLQAFEGVCIARRNRGLNSSFTVRKISYGEGVERVFPLYSPRIDSVQVVRRGDVRRAKLYYLRQRRGKSARIAEKTTGAAGKIAVAEREAQQKAKKKS